MVDAIRFVFFLLTRLVVPLRYTIHVLGWEKIRSLKGPVLLLPNHPAWIDPVLILATFYGTFRPRTVLYDENFPLVIRSLLVKMLRGVAIPNLSRPSEQAHQRTELAIAEVIAGLRRGENFLMWPSGRAERDGVERLGAVSALTEILREVPEANVVLVQTRGVWGSMFSYARTGQMPRLGRCLWNGAMLLACNLFVLMPRRHVTITVERLDRKLLPPLEKLDVVPVAKDPRVHGAESPNKPPAAARERDQINRWFEKWYNPAGPEIPTYVPYHFLFGPKSYTFPASPKLNGGEFTSDEILPETATAIAEMFSAKLGRVLTADQLKPETKLEDLGLDSLQRMDLVFAVEQRFDVSSDSTPDSMGQLMALAEGHSKKVARKAPPKWFRPPSRQELPQIFGQTIPEAFVTRALLNLRDVAAADDFSGVVTYERLLVGTLLMSRRFARLPQLKIGLMLPASVASDMMLFGLYLSNKLPVLLNWTTGPANLRHSVELTGITYVISSRALRDRLGTSAEIQGVTFLDVEDLQRHIGWMAKLYWLLRVRLMPETVRRLVPKQQPDTQAVILFTSGSEKAPKGVPLTHANVMSNLRMIPSVLDLTNRDSFLGFLPMFHSFGLTATGLFPILSGVRVVHHPDPTDVAALTKKIADYLPTVTVGMPSMIGHLFDRATSGELHSLKLIVVGAEACPASLYTKACVMAPNALILEGYGVTECSPLIAGNHRTAYRPGTVGQPLPGVEVCVLDLETKKVLPSEAMGILLVNGPGVFNGYLGDEQSPFEYHDGKRWYVTGDLVAIDSDGFIHFHGRLKRFIKAGGEMISLPALEEPFTRRYPPDKNGPHVAVQGVETATGRNIVLFTNESISLTDANACLAQDGFRGVMRLDAVQRLDKIPLLGTGKIDYRQLKTLLKTDVQTKHEGFRISSMIHSAVD